MCSRTCSSNSSSSSTIGLCYLTYKEKFTFLKLCKHMDDVIDEWLIYSRIYSKSTASLILINI